MDILQFFKTNVSRFINTGVIVIIAAILIIAFRFLINRFINRKRTHNKRATTMAKLLNSIVRYTIILLAVLAVLSVWGVDIKPFLAGAGILGLAVGFGAQDLVKDIVSGFFIILDNYFDVDEAIEINGFKGRVIEVGLKSTRIVNWKGDIKIFSNRLINEVINYSKLDSMAVVNFKVRYKEDLERIYKLVDEALVGLKEEVPQVKTEPNIWGVVALEESGVMLRVSVKTKPETHYPVERAINRRISDMFRKHDIDVAFKQVIIAESDIND